MNRTACVVAGIEPVMETVGKFGPNSASFAAVGTDPVLQFDPIVRLVLLGEL